MNSSFTRGIVFIDLDIGHVIYLEEGNKDAYQLYKNMKFVLTSNRSTLIKKDRRAKENNLYLSKTYSSRGIPLPPEARKIESNSEHRLDNLLAHCLTTGVVCLATIKTLQYYILPSLLETAPMNSRQFIRPLLFRY
jgi:hypothetical protein